ncbi:MAG: hypothetical protein WC291_04495 [Thermodesulfovibrionales bacterium]|jgi:hypothetical protein
MRKTKSVKAMRDGAVILSLILSLIIPLTALAGEKKADTGQAVSITGMQFLTDTGDEALLMITGSSGGGSPKFREELVRLEGKDWLRIRMNPAILSEEKRIRLDSLIIGEVRLEHDPEEKEAVLISLELLPVMLSYSVSSVKNSSNLMVSVTNLDRKTAQTEKP